MEQKPKAVGPSPRRLRVALVLSLAFNLLFVGLAVGAVLNWRSDGGPPRSFDLSSSPLGRALEPEDRRAIAEALRDRSPVRPPSRSERSALTQSIVDVLREDPFDVERFTELLNGQMNRGQEIQEAAQSILVGRIAELSPQERLDFADRIERQMRRGPSDGPRN